MDEAILNLDELFIVIFFLVLNFIFSLRQADADGKPVINEFLVHPSSGDKEWVELFVPDGVDVTKYWIDDDTDFGSDSGSSGKKQITSAMQGSDSRHVVYELSSSMFNNNGDTVALFAPDGTLVDHYYYMDDPGSNISIGRTPDATGDFQVLSFATRGSPNSNPKPPDTATPEPTNKPTKIPKPPDTPKSAKSTPTINSLVDKEVLADAITVSYSKKSNASVTQEASLGARPTSILGVSTKSAEKKVYHLPKQQVLVKGTTSALPQVIAGSGVAHWVWYTDIFKEAGRVASLEKGRMKKIVTNSFKETQKMGFDFAKKLQGGEVLALYGDLGSGKTTFVQGLAAGLGIERPIISPTFIIMRTYKISRHSGKPKAHPESNRSWTSQDDGLNIKNFYHVDLYRIHNADEVQGLGLLELLGDPQNLVAIEWPDKIENLLPENRIDIMFEYLGDDKREIRTG